MKLNEVINMLEEAKNPFNENSLDYLSNREIDIVIGLLQQGEKYKQIVEEIEEIMAPGKIIEYEGCLSVSTIINSIQKIIKEIKQKYFPKGVNNGYNKLL